MNLGVVLSRKHPGTFGNSLSIASG
jgi:hypothetical protein